MLAESVEWGNVRKLSISQNFPENDLLKDEASSQCQCENICATTQESP